jgi:hypothetical protein
MNLNSVWKFIKEWAKTIAAFVSVWLGNAVLALIQGSSPWPQTKQEWIQYGVTSLVAALGVGVTRNKITQKQLDKDPNVVGGTVVPDSQVPPPAPTGGFKNPWR